MKLKYYQITFRAFNHRRRRVRKKYFIILKKIDEKRKNQESVRVWENFLFIEKEKGR